MIFQSSRRLLKASAASAVKGTLRGDFPGRPCGMGGLRLSPGSCDTGSDNSLHFLRRPGSVRYNPFSSTFAQMWCDWLPTKCKLECYHITGKKQRRSQCCQRRGERSEIGPVSSRWRRRAVRIQNRWSHFEKVCFSLLSIKLCKLEQFNTVQPESDRSIIGLIWQIAQATMVILNAFRKLHMLSGTQLAS